jgi:Ohr subfamily peroxiredoxin
MKKVMYTAEAHVAGGRREGHGRTLDGELEVDLRWPGAGAGTNPEALFALGYGACFENALRSVARRRRIQVGDVSVDTSVDLWTQDDATFNVGVRLQLSIPAIPDAAQAAELVAAAHEICPYSRATRGNIDFAVTANGEPVAFTDDVWSTGSRAAVGERADRPRR